MKSGEAVEDELLLGISILCPPYADIQPLLWDPLCPKHWKSQDMGRIQGAQVWLLLQFGSKPLFIWSEQTRAEMGPRLNQVDSL